MDARRPPLRPWRRAALAPLLVMVPLLVYSLVALGMGSNLWPLLFILAAPLCFFYLCGVSALDALGG